MTDRTHDPADPHNGPAYHTGEPCIEKGCDKPAGTWWSPYWCQPCNAKRMDRISRSLEEIGKGFDERKRRPMSEPSEGSFDALMQFAADCVNIGIVEACAKHGVGSTSPFSGCFVFEPCVDDNLNPFRRIAALEARAERAERLLAEHVSKYRTLPDGSDAKQSALEEERDKWKRVAVAHSRARVAAYESNSAMIAAMIELGSAIEALGPAWKEAV